MKYWADQWPFFIYLFNYLHVCIYSPLFINMALFGVKGLAHSRTFYVLKHTAELNNCIKFVQPQIVSDFKCDRHICTFDCNSS